MDKSWALDFKDYHNGLDFAHAALRNRHWAVAAAWMDRVHGLEPTDWKDRLDFARAAFRGGQRELACLWLERTVKARPKEERMWNEIALLFAEMENPVWPAHP
jgi:hypothetical protein